MSAKSEQHFAIDKSWKPADVIEALGFGPAQIQYLMLAHGIWFVESLQVGLSVVFTVFAATHNSWSRTQRASLASLLFAGIALGSSVGGYLGDRLGRRPPILICYTMAGIVQLLMIIDNTYWVIAMLRVLLGFAHGLGMPPSLALVSETSPAKHRRMMQGLRNILFAMGQIIACVVCLIDDPSYKHMHWRGCLLVGAILPFVILPFVAIRMHDSPTLLARLGRDDEAKKSLEEMQRLNGKDGRSGAVAVDVTYTRHGTFFQQPGMAESPSWRQQVNIIFSRHLFFSTLTLIVASFCVNCILYGHMYAFPLVAAKEATKTAMKPGYLTLMQSVISIPIAIAVALVAILLNCQKLLALSSIAGILGTVGFAATGGLHDRTGVLNVIYYVSQNLPCVCTAFGFLAAFQLAVELYPVQVAATSAALIVASGRIGSIVIPYVFELFETWQSFYYFLTGLSVLTFMMTVTLLGPSPRTEEKQGQLVGKDIEETKPLVAK